MKNSPELSRALILYVAAELVDSRHQDPEEFDRWLTQLRALAGGADASTIDPDVLAFLVVLQASSLWPPTR